MIQKGPLYYRIKEDIKERIGLGEYKPGDVLPTETSLCEQYGASRVTIRRSIDELIAEKIIERGFGKTARVKCDAVPRSINRLSGLHEELSKQGIKCSSFILHSGIENPSPDLRETLGISQNETVLKVERIRYANGQPICYQIFYTPSELMPDFEVNRLLSESLYDIMEKDYGISISEATQSISAQISDYRMTALLELPSQTGLLKTCRRAVDVLGRCVEYTVSYYVASRYSMDMNLRRDYLPV